MIVGVPKECVVGEKRVSVLPAGVQKLVQAGVSVCVQSGLGAALDILDQSYEQAGAKVVDNASDLYSQSDLVLRLRKPSLEDVALMPSGLKQLSFLDPFHEAELVDALAAHGVTAMSMEMIPRSTIAQKMDALSSQANLAGYVAVILGAERMNQILPMMTTPAGTISPARVFVIGVGVAGLQAIATAKRLGARVEAFDTRPVVEEQVQSLGAKFVKIDLGETGQTKDGYAKALTAEQLEMQRAGMAKVCAQSDLVITTAQLFGRKPPLLLTKEMVAGMKPGAVIVDMAAESGGNVEGSVPNEEVLVNGVRIVGLGNLPGRVAADASAMYSSNLVNFILHFWDKEKKEFLFELSNDILKGCVVTHDGAVVNEMVLSVRKGV